MDTKLKKYLSIMELESTANLTPDIIKLSYRKLSRKYHPDQAAPQYRDGKQFILLTEAKDYLLANLSFLNAKPDIDNVDISTYEETYSEYHQTNYYRKERNDRRTPYEESIAQAVYAYIAKDFVRAEELFDSIDRALYGKNIRISSILTPDELVMFGISCLMGNLRYRKSHSFIYSFGYPKSRWVSKTWIDGMDHNDLPNDFSVIKKQIEEMIENHPCLDESLVYCSSKVFGDYQKIKTFILNAAKQEWEEHRELSNRIYREPELLLNYLNMENGFFLYNTQIYYVFTSDSWVESSPIYKVRIVGKRLHLKFHKFSRFERKSGSELDEIWCTVKLATKKFLQLDAPNVPMCYTYIASEDEHIEYNRLMKYPRKGYCPLCGGKNFLGICVQNCRSQIKKNK